LIFFITRGIVILAAISSQFFNVTTGNWDLTIEQAFWYNAIRTSVLEIPTLGERSQVTMRVSDKQKEMLAFIENFVDRNGFPPTHEEIRVGLNISTKSLVNYHLEALEDAALLSRTPNTPRGIRLVSDNPTASSLVMEGVNLSTARSNLNEQRS
jgi:hypothetical protein